MLGRICKPPPSAVQVKALLQENELSQELEKIFFGAVHPVSSEVKIEAAKRIRAEADRCPLVIEDWAYERDRAEQLLQQLTAKDQEIAAYREALRDARKEIDRWGYGDFHYGDTPRDPNVLVAIARIDATLDRFNKDIEDQP